MDITRVGRGAKNARPLIDTSDPAKVAPFLLGLGYEPELVVNTLVQKCRIDAPSATALVGVAGAALTKGAPREVCYPCESRRQPQGFYAH